MTKVFIVIASLPWIMQAIAQVGSNLDETVIVNANLWPSTVISYEIISETDHLQYQRYARRVILAALNEFNKRTCIRFISNDAETSSQPAMLDIRIQDGRFCPSLSFGHSPSPTLLFGYQCSMRDVMNAIMQMLGIVAEQRRIDRDQYVKMIWRNMLREGRQIFSKMAVHYNSANGTDLHTQLLRLPYDYQSITHARIGALSQFDYPTISPIYTGGRKIGLVDSFSYGDLMKLNILYNCDLPLSSQSAPAFEPLEPALNLKRIHRFIRIWPNGVVPYVIETGAENLTHFAERTKSVREAFQIFNQKSCLPLEPLNETSHIRDYLVIVFTEYCLNTFGRLEGPQQLSIGPQCSSVHSIHAALLNAIGITHDIGRPDRDKHFKIISITNMAEIPMVEAHYVNADGDFINYDVLKESVDYEYISHFFHVHDDNNGNISLILKTEEEVVYPSSLSDGIATKIRHVYNCSDDKRAHMLQNDTDDEISSITRTLWPTTIIPFEVHSEIDNPQAMNLVERVISAAVDEFTQRTCIRFNRTFARLSAKNSVRILIRNGDLCQLRSGGGLGSIITLADSCTDLRDILGMLMWVLSIPRENRRVDRDNYVTVLRQNIPQEYMKYSSRQMVHYNDSGIELSGLLLKLPYDYFSITHSPFKSFDNGKLPMFLPRYETGWKMGVISQLSSGDLYKLNLLYNCSIKADLNEKSFELGHLVQQLEPTVDLQSIRLWPKSVIPYIVENDTASNPYYNEQYARNFNEAFLIYNRNSCVPLIPRNDSHIRDYLVIYFSEDCGGLTLGRVGGPQRFGIGARCNTIGFIVQALLHVAGITTDLQRIDRDQFFRFNGANIEDWPFATYGHKFRPIYLDANDNLMPYDVTTEKIDYHKIALFFHTNDDNNDGTVTLVPKKPVEIRTPDSLSSGDVTKIRHLYNCTIDMPIRHDLMALPFTISPSHTVTFQFVVVAAIVALLIGFLTFILIHRLIRCLRHHKRTERINQAISDFSSKNCDKFPQFDAKSVILAEFLGKGNFGTVHKATLEPQSMQVAVKMVKTECFLEAMGEAKMHYTLIHENIVAIIGMAFQGKHTMIILEFMDLGSLKDFLLESIPPPIKGYKSAEEVRILELHHLIGICYQVACGLTYMAVKNVVHRDLAARNCLVATTQNDHFSIPYLVKISDFGLSRRLFGTTYYMTGGKYDTPVIVAPECLKTLKYTQESDMWSFGLTMWEILNYGGDVFDELPNEIIQKQITSGIFPEQSEHCSDEMYAFMKKCSSYDPNQRPSAAQAEEHLRLLVQKNMHSRPHYLAEANLKDDESDEIQVDHF